MRTVHAVAVGVVAAVLTCALLQGPLDVLAKGNRAGSTATESMRVDTYFSPEGGVEEALIAEIDAAQKEALVAMYLFTSRPLADALGRAKARGVDVRVVLDKSQKTVRYGKASEIAKDGIALKLMALGKTGDGVPIKLHHKFLVVDGQVVGTGSFNWTSQADGDNYENIVVIRSKKVAKAFRDEFLRIWELAEDATSTKISLSGPTPAE